jgi:hypothetical protein
LGILCDHISLALFPIQAFPRRFVLEAVTTSVVIIKDGIHCEDCVFLLPCPSKARLSTCLAHFVTAMYPPSLHHSLEYLRDHTSVLKFAIFVHTAVDVVMCGAQC